jgi:hypothetical protein
LSIILGIDRIPTAAAVRLAGQLGGSLGMGAELLMAAKSASIPAHIPAPAAD